jgi:hypothetical protein
MNDQEINAAIAESRGLYIAPDLADDLTMWLCSKQEPNGIKSVFGLTKKAAFAELAPHYTTDLNAMHEAWLTLTRDLRLDFWCNLQTVCAKETPHTSKPGDFDTGNATARQRAEAFLRTVGKWKE